MTPDDPRPAAPPDATGLEEAVVADLARLLARMPDPAGSVHGAALERELAATTGVRHAVAVSSGTAALHTALRALHIGPGDDVLVPALSVIMSVAPIIHAGARPVFVDCDPTDADLDYDDLDRKITPSAKAILPVYLWGRPGDPARLARTAAEHGLAVVEDACQAQGSRADGRLAGTTGDFGCFSLKDGKVLWAGEGGYLLTDRDDIAQRARSFRSHQQPPPPEDGHPAEVGYNYRLAEPLALIARANLARFDTLAARRRHQACLLADLLTGTPGIDVTDVPARRGWNGYSFLATVTLDEPRAFCEHLARRGVPNSVGTFGLVPADQRPALAPFTTAPCPHAAAVVDRTLAVVLTDHDDEQRLTGYAQTIFEEARRWRS
ncbi:aminotransferase class I/II-fold pyridoxal phosphate-dependent enzyme [Micromonospora aurantiaca]|uniref:DegT/DnrJ/EryC1/StrS family aminotransferase n=1 Tax=Micromonospora aurantiaca (nom. illeg.) TaxID=47850 RepID=UPI000F3DD95F|nr:aminotransferase class I/II-fold pyridoxal phosphate-dependent enzyme [Micromonospora aurantiaca]RNH98281.1 aminotransferase class I/II-fold pyridoxal phosphate-dependent enzyme [Micromonospora aurantiaca]